MSQEFLRYKGRPLVRSGDTLYYGSMGDKCVAHLQIKSNKQDHGLNMADKVVIQLISTDETLPLKDRMLNKAERDGLYEALSIASIWMDRHNKKEQESLSLQTIPFVLWTGKQHFFPMKRVSPNRKTVRAYFIPCQNSASILTSFVVSFIQVKP